MWLAGVAFDGDAGAGSMLDSSTSCSWPPEPRFEGSGPVMRLPPKSSMRRLGDPAKASGSAPCKLLLLIALRVAVPVIRAEV